jgi:hypothetical protein
VPTTLKTLDQKLAALRARPGGPEFILADARDADMAWGIAGPGAHYPPRPGRPYRSMPEFIDEMRAALETGCLDILLASTSTMSALAHRERRFVDSPVTPAIRANDTSDVWISRVANYRADPSRPFRSSFIEEAQYGSLTAPRDGQPLVNLGLYSITFNNRLDSDLASLAAFRDFREEAARLGFTYFLEVFAPNVADCGLDPQQIPSFVNDSLVRTLAGVSREHWPRFLKIPYFGPGPMEELAAYDPELVVGILGGGSGTTMDAFAQLAEAKKYGARAALYGRKIKESEDQGSFIRHLRGIADDQIQPAEAVKSYHGSLQKAGIRPRRELAADLALTAPELSYARPSGGQ